MRSRSNSGVQLDNYQRLVYKTILKYQVKFSLVNRFLQGHCAVYKADCAIHTFSTFHCFRTREVIGLVLVLDSYW